MFETYFMNLQVYHILERASANNTKTMGKINSSFS